MHPFLKLHISRAFLISRHFRLQLSSHEVPESFYERGLAFERDVKATDPKVLATSMGGYDKPRGTSALDF